MLNQEDLYQHILKEEWTKILDLLYAHKKTISTDTMLKQASVIFETEFFRKISNYPINRQDIEENLDTLFLLHKGNFFILSKENYKTLNLEIIKRKPLKIAIDYARHFPEEEICKEIIRKFEALEPNVEISAPKPKPKPIPMNWILIYNRLFELINNQSDKNTYFSGPRFIDIIREFDNYFPNYAQYIALRTSEGKSTSRKIFYYDILMGIAEPTRKEVIKRILGELNSFLPDKVKIIEGLLNPQVAIQEVVTPPKKETVGNHIVFISYSWDDDPHKQWVLNLANRLCSDGVNVILDRYHLKPGKNLPHFVETSIAQADRIIIVFTPNYKLKADKREGGVGYEYSIMNVDLYKTQTSNEKIIPILRAGSKENSIPTFMQQFIHLDVRNDNTFEASYTDLLREIYNEPAITQPEIGIKPTFEKQTTDEVIQPKIGIKPS